MAELFLYILLFLCVVDLIIGLIGAIKGIIRFVAGKRAFGFLTVAYYSVYITVFSYIVFALAKYLLNI